MDESYTKYPDTKYFYSNRIELTNRQNTFVVLEIRTVVVFLESLDKEEAG